MNRHPKQLGAFAIGELGSTPGSRMQKLQSDNAQLAFKNRTLSATVAKQAAQLAAAGKTGGAAAAAIASAGAPKAARPMFRRR